MRKHALVRNLTAGVSHQVAATDDEVLRAFQLPDAHSVEISDVEGGLLLIRYDRDGNFAGDTWHKNLEDAFAQARYEFGVDESDWVRIDN